MMSYIKSIVHIWAGLLLFVLASCADDAIVSPSRGVVDENGMVTLNFDANIPGLKLTRAVDINGEAISTLWLVAFNENGNMISRVLATIGENTVTGGTEGGGGTFTAQVPSSTRVLHFLANVNMDNFSDQENIGRHENEVIAPMVSSSGNLVYWGRREFADVKALADFAANSASDPVILYRNQALVQYKTEGTGIKVLGWAALNQYAYGTVAPFDASNTEDAFHFNLTASGTAEDDFVTTLPEEYNVKQTDVESVSQASALEGDPRYLFETPNPEDDQVYLIMRISKNDGEPKYYKILLVNDQKEPYAIIRNHKYIVNISDVNEAYGVTEFEQAKTATPANNPWITISDEIPEVVNGGTTLRVEGETTVLYQEAGEYEIGFYYDGTIAPTAEFISNEGVGEVTSVEWSADTHQGIIHVSINAPAEGEIMSGTIQLKESNGVLSRRIKVLTSKPFEFTPVWVASEIPLLDGENIAVLFHIPDDFPEELLPVDVKFGCDLIDAQTTQPLKVITEATIYTVPNGPNSTHEVKKDWNYKYVYTAEHVGQHRVDFRTILTNVNSIESSEFHVYMEGDDPDTGQDLFKHRDLFFAFQPNSADVNGNDNHRYRRRILLEGGEARTRFTTRTINDLEPIYGETISIPFELATLQDDSDIGNLTWDDDVQPPYLNGRETEVSATNPCTLWVYYDPTLVRPEWTTETAKRDKYGNTYSEYTATQQHNELTFTTISPNFDCYIVLSARSDSYDTFDEDLGVNPSGWGFRAASVTVHSTGRLDFNPQFSTDGMRFTPIADGEEYEIPYGTGQDVYVRINIEPAAQGKAFQFRVKTSNLTPVVESGQEAWSQDGDEWVYTFAAGETAGILYKDFHFQTTRLVSSEDITLASGSYVGYNSVSVRIGNADLSGTIRLPQGVTFQIPNPYIILERNRDGTRIGTFAVQGNPQGQDHVEYRLALRGEYNLNAWDEVNVKWAPVSGENQGTTYSYSCTLQELMQVTTIQLEALQP